MRSPRTTATVALPPALAWLDETPFYQAGLQGYSDAAMRIVARRLGAPYCVTEALDDRTLLRGGRGRDAARLTAEDHPIAGQILGASSSTMADAARTLVDLGYDVVDVNIACPVKRVRGDPKGGHLLAEPERAIEILRAVRDAVALRVPSTLKLRRAADDSPESEGRFRRILEAAIELGYASATIHGRTVAQKYVGPSDSTAIARVVRDYAPFPILGSGDVTDPQAILRMLETTGVRGVSVARGAIANPWIFRETLAFIRGETTPPPSLSEQRRVLDEHARLSLELHGLEHTGRRLRKLAILLARRHHPRGEEAAIAIASVGGFGEDWWRKVDELWPPVAMPLSS